MTQLDIDRIIAQGEGVSVELKEAKEKVPASLYETVVSFANTNGGYILLGVDDERNVTGIPPENRAKFLKNIVTALNSKDNINPVMYLFPVSCWIGRNTEFVPGLSKPGTKSIKSKMPENQKLEYDTQQFF